VLTSFDLTFLGIGGIIGAGVFVLTGTAAREEAGCAQFHSSWTKRIMTSTLSLIVPCWSMSTRSRKEKLFELTASWD
jgi:amino acid transporter